MQLREKECWLQSKKKGKDKKMFHRASWVSSKSFFPFFRRRRVEACVRQKMRNVHEFSHKRGFFLNNNGDRV